MVFPDPIEWINSRPSIPRNPPAREEEMRTRPTVAGRTLSPHRRPNISGRQAVWWVYIRPSTPPLYISIRKHMDNMQWVGAPYHCSVFSPPLVRLFSSLSSFAFPFPRFSPSLSLSSCPLSPLFLVSSRLCRVCHCPLGIKNIIFWLFARR